MPKPSYKAIKELHSRCKTPTEDMPETKAAYRAFDKWRKTLGGEAADLAEELCMDACAQSEMQGFCRGFQYAMKLAAECGLMGNGGATA